MRGKDGALTCRKFSDHNEGTFSKLGVKMNQKNSFKAFGGDEAAMFLPCNLAFMAHGTKYVIVNVFLIFILL